ncbi:MAG: Tim44 domain-containing protein [Labilithrix sp.]|nr:Tim44 domain-containing protein [Labilithrix sp.]
MSARHARAARPFRALLVWLVVVVAGAHLAWASEQLAFADERVALARPGGGGSFRGGSSSGSRSGSSSGGFRSGSSSSSSGSRSGSSSSSSSGGFRSGSSTSSSGYVASPSSGSSSGGGAGLGFGFILVFGIIVVLGVVVRSKGASSWSTSAPVMHWHPPPPPPPQISARRRLLALREHDPNFSLVLFDDFLVALYTEIKTAQGRGQLARYQPYLAPQAMSALPHPGGEITSVIVGSATIEDVRGLDPSSSHVWVRVAFETNYAIRRPNGESALYCHEEWMFARRRDAKSRTPDKAHVIGCPSCGAPLDVVVAGVCNHCRANVTAGAFDWIVDSISVIGTEARGPMLTSNVEEVGNDLPTVIDPGAAPRFAALQAADPGTTWQGLSSRVGLVFTEFQIAWAARDLVKMRPFMSDALFATQTFWVEEYKRQRLRNVTENARIASLELANVTQDAFFDAVTVRLYASSLDYTVSDADSRIVSGNRTTPRHYTEYWTLIRGRGRRGAPKLDKSCPNCGAPLDVTMVGVCNYCKVKVTTGEFDWVLSRIEQDEVYRG